MGNRLMMKLFVASETFFFLCIMVAYVYFWQSAHFTGAALHHLNIKTSGFFTALLIASSLSFHMVERRQSQEDIKSMKRWLGITVLLGIVFLLGQAHEYYQLLKEDLTLSSNEFGTSFYTLTGFHSLHVLLGLVMLTIIWGLSQKGYMGKSNSSALSAAGIYWHFVDAVWVVVFTLIYVMPHFIHL